MLYSSEPNSEDSSNDEEGDDTSEQTSAIKTAAISKDFTNRLYISTDKGIFYTDDKAGWQKITNLGLTSFNIRTIIFDNENKVIVATGKGVFRLGKDVWEQIDGVLGYKEVNDLVVDNEGVIWIAAKDGLFKFKEQKDDNLTLENNGNEQISQSELKDLFKGEPTIKEVQNAAI